MKPVFTSREIRIGHLSLGGLQPVRLQSMTNTPTRDTDVTVQQVEKLVKSGCDLVRITVSSMQEAENIKNIQQALLKKGIDVPLIADVHFQPKVAEHVARFVEKVRINPGNFSGSHHKNKIYTDAEYQTELKQIAQNLAPLIQTCKAQGTALRIGINHGSLSDRILYRYGNTAEGMVAAALEYVSVCREQGFENLTLSLKASNIAIMLEANRLLVSEMSRQKLAYPLHLGVTEAGNGIEGRIKSAMGIGTLLAEGIGDTIRVSLTEAPENEIPVARKLVHYYGRGNVQSPVKGRYVFYDDLNEHERQNLVLLDEYHKINQNDLVLVLSYPELSFDDLALLASVDFNLFYEKRKPDFVLLKNGKRLSVRKLTSLALNILQARGIRYSKTEFIACPSCGRTHFDIEKELDKVKRRFANLKGVKIAVMGCNVNGPGEMAGADYGYVGAGSGKVNIYKGKDVVFRLVAADKAMDMLEKLIRENQSF